MIFNWFPKIARCRKVAGVRFFADFAEILRKLAVFLLSARLVFALSKL